MSDYVKFLRDTSPYINTHRGKTFVLALSGEAVAHANFNHIVQDIALLNSLGIRLVLVHGARAQIAQRLESCDISASFDCNKRITDAVTMECVKDAVGGTRITIESQLSTDTVNSPMHGAKIRVVSGNFVTAKPLGVRSGIDFHHTGEVRRIDRKGIISQLDSGAIVLLSPIGYSPTGEAFNLNYEDVATQAAVALQAEKLMIFSSQAGIIGPSGKLEKMISLPEVAGWLDQLTDSNPSYHALQACSQACENGVPRGHIVSFQEDGALLTELFTREGSGTLILQDGLEVIRQAAIEDIGGLLELLTPLEEQGVLVRRSRELLETEIFRFSVMQYFEGTIIGCAALYPFTDASGNTSAELACVAIHPDFQNRGFAVRLLANIEQEAAKQGIQQVFVLTTQTSHWFRENGFTETTIDQLPEEKQSLYNFQRNSKILIKHL